MLTFVYSDHTGSRWLHINNAKLLTRKRAKCVVCQEFVRYLLADWSNPILHIHDDYRWSEVLVCHFVMFAVGVRCVLPNFLLDEKRILPLKKKMASTFGEEKSVDTHFFRWSVSIFFTFYLTFEFAINISTMCARRTWFSSRFKLQDNCMVLKACSRTIRNT